MSETIWKKKKPKRNINNHVNNNYDGPYGEILFNLQRPDIKPVFEKNDNNNVNINEGFIEGASFEIFPDTKAYYNSCKSFFSGLKSSNKKKVFNSIIKMLVSPFSHVDEAIKNFLLYLIQPPTEDKKDDDIVAKQTTDWNFFWRSYDDRVYKENFQEGLGQDNSSTQSIPVEFTTLNEFLNIYNDTINSILDNHPWIEQNNLYYNLCEYYAQELKKDYDSKSTGGANYSTKTLYNFNDYLNNELDNEDKYLNILRNVTFKWSKSTIPPSTTTPSGSGTGTTPPTKKSNPIDPNLLKDVKVIKEFIYQLLLVPVYFYVAYNFYFLMYFRKDNSSDNNGNLKKIGCELNEFPNWDTIFDNSVTGLITEFIFKPTKIFPIFFNALIYFLPNYGVNKLTPYISFFLSISIVVALLNGLFPVMFKILVDFLWDFKFDLGLYIYCSIIIWIYFVIFIFRDIKKTLEDRVKSSAGGAPPPSFFSLVMTLLSKLIYYIIKGAFTYMIIPMSTMVFVIYFLYIMFFSIGDFKNIQYINQYIYSNLFDTNPIDENIFGEKDHEPQKFNVWIKTLNVYIDKIRTVFNPIFTFLFEFILCMLYLTYYNNSYSRINSDKAPNIKTAFVIISILFFVLMSIWIFGYKMPNLFKPNEIKVEQPEPTCEYKNTEKAKYSIIECITDEFNREEELIEKKKEQLKNKLKSYIPSIPSIPSMSIPSSIQDLPSSFKLS